MESSRYRCTRHKVALELWTFDGFPYWQCPEAGCRFVKPCKAGRRIGKRALAKIKSEVVRIGTNGTRQGFKFAVRMFNALPELKES